MKDYTGTITEILVEGGTTYAIVGARGMNDRVSLTLVMDARVGDEVRVESGVAMEMFPRPTKKLAGDAAR